MFEDFDPSLLEDDCEDLIDQPEGEDEYDRNPNMTDAERVQARQDKLLRNREIARNCRKRKREKIEGLIEEVSILRETNRQLELKLKMAQNKVGQATSGRGNRGKDEEDRRVSEVKSLLSMIPQRSSDEEILGRLEGYTKTYADFGEERHKLVKVHVGQLEQLLLPTQVSKMLLWILKQDDEFYTDNNPDSIWNMLSKHLSLDAHQKEQIKEQRTRLGAQNTSMKKCLKMLTSFENEVQQNMKIRKGQMDEVMKIITPSQTIKFLQWVEENQACIHMLNGLWSVNKQRQQEVMNDILQ